MKIKVKVRPNSNKEEIIKIGDDEYFIRLKEKAENNKANNRLINLIARETGVNAGDIKIKNPKSKNKILDIKE